MVEINTNLNFGMHDPFPEIMPLLNQSGQTCQNLLNENPDECDKIFSDWVIQVCQTFAPYLKDKDYVFKVIENLTNKLLDYKHCDEKLHKTVVNQTLDLLKFYI